MIAKQISSAASCADSTCQPSALILRSGNCVLGQVNIHLSPIRICQHLLETQSCEHSGFAPKESTAGLIPAPRTPVESCLRFGPGGPAGHVEIRAPEEGAEGVLCGGGNSQGAYAEVVRTPLIEQGAYSLLLSLQEPAVCMTVLFICSFFSFIYVFSQYFCSGCLWFLPQAL